ncbi:GNAT family N-acetyltransferase [Vibrio salinus]|uniref:GNAT family N-acetyltransferase n=1 Tax=Vibrio salinus TaxID=2899784 RepID=UPI001E4A919D|nr:GNAT family N-acetyltransferase [Vibrio salinus]MCE0496235.1 GNAT family N-acetyltransferase [Vibrio salinus]
MLKLLKKEEIQNVIDGLRTLRLSAFRKNAVQNKARVQIESLKTTYKDEINHLIKDIFSGEQNIPPHLVPLSADIPQKWWIARSGEYILGAVACWKENETWHWGRFVVDDRFRGLGIGKSLARHSLNQMWQETDELQIDARDTTVGILQNLGGEILGEKMDFYGMPVTPMRMTQQQFRGAGEPEELIIPITQ